MFFLNHYTQDQHYQNIAQELFHNWYKKLTNLLLGNAFSMQAFYQDPRTLTQFKE